MDYSVYDGILRRDLGLWITVGILLFISACICFAYLLIKRSDFRSSKEGRWELAILLFLAMAVAVGTPIVFLSEVTDSLWDLKNQAYIEYEGEFSVVYDEKTPSRQASLLLPDGNRFNTSHTYEAGVYEGRVVYTERSHKLLAVEFAEDFEREGSP